MGYRCPPVGFAAWGQDLYATDGRAEYRKPHHQQISCAGLIVGHLSARYSVTKHAAVALSGSMYLELQKRNSMIKVSVLFPAMVRTDIAEVERDRPAEMRNEPVELRRERQAGLAAFKIALEREPFYILTHPE